jgi:hypothetical protein
MRLPLTLFVAFLFLACAANPPVQTVAIKATPTAQKALHIDLGQSEAWNDGDVAWTAATSDGIAVSSSEHVFGTRRPKIYGTALENLHTLNTAVANGSYTIVLHLAELDETITAAGQRVFSIDVEGNAIKDLDIWNLAGGPRVPLVKSLPVVVNDGALSLQFNWKGTHGSLLNAIEILPDIALPEQGNASASLVLENFDDIVNNDGVAKVIAWDGRNNHSELSLADADLRKLGTVGQAIRWDYTIDASIGYGDRSSITIPKFKANPVDIDAAGVNAVRFWWKPDGSGRNFSIQLGGKGVWWNYDLPMTDNVARWVTIPFSVFGRGNMAFSSRPGPVTGNLIGVAFFMQYIPGAELGSGTVWLDELQFVKTTDAPNLPTFKAAQKVTAMASVLDDFESYENNEELRANFGNIVHGHMCTLSTVPAQNGTGKRALKLDYGFGKREYSGMVMMPHVDWSQYNAFRFWVKPDNSKNILHTILVSGGTWEHKLPLVGTEPQWVELPFSELFGDIANMKHVEEIMMRVRNEPGGASEGSILIDDIEAIRSDKYPMTLKALPPPPEFPAGKTVRIDSGAETDHVDAEGQTWLADQGFVWGNPTGRTKCDYAFTFAGLRDDQMYCTERVGFPGYRFRVKNGAYTVRLHFVENWAPITSARQRLFGLTVNGVAQADVDPFADGGGLHKTSVRDVPVTVTNGELNVGFVTKITQPRIAGLEIIPTATKPAAKLKRARAIGAFPIDEALPIANAAAFLSPRLLSHQPPPRKLLLP